jgi:hypothetical protein
MPITTRRRARRLALVAVAAPVAAWALEQAARRAEARGKTSPTSRRLRQGADFVQRFGRGRWPSDWDGDRSLEATTTAARRPAR